MKRTKTLIKELISILEDATFKNYECSSYKGLCTVIRFHSKMDKIASDFDKTYLVYLIKTYAEKHKESLNTSESITYWGYWWKPMSILDSKGIESRIEFLKHLLNNLPGLFTRLNYRFKSLIEEIDTDLK